MNAEQQHNVYNRLRNLRHLNTFIILTRLLIGFAFVPSGLKKILGLRFTKIGTDTQVGYFFEGLYQSGFYWEFLGYGQVLAAFLLMTQRFATFGAIIFMFIISNIWVITVAMHFTGTWVITSLMLLACLLLLLWDFHKFRFIFFPDNFSLQTNNEYYPTYNRLWIFAGFVLFILSITGSYFVIVTEALNPVWFFAWLGLVSAIVIVALISSERRFKSHSR